MWLTPKPSRLADIILVTDNMRLQSTCRIWLWPGVSQSLPRCIKAWTFMVQILSPPVEICGRSIESYQIHHFPRSARLSVFPYWYNAEWLFLEKQRASVGRDSTHRGWFDWKCVGKSGCCRRSWRRYNLTGEYWIHWSFDWYERFLSSHFSSSGLQASRFRLFSMNSADGVLRFRPEGQLGRWQ